MRIPKVSTSHRHFRGGVFLASMMGILAMMAIYFFIIPNVYAAAPGFVMDSWKDGQDKIVIEFDQGVENDSMGSVDAADFTVSGVNSIAISSVTHDPGDHVVILTLASNLNSAGGTDFTIGCASNAVYNFMAEACATSGVNVYTAISEDTTGPSISQVLPFSTTGVFVEFDEAVDETTLIAPNFTLTTSDAGDDSTITSVTAFGFGIDIQASGAIVATGAGNTLQVSTSVTDVVGNASAGETVTILPSIAISEVQVGTSGNSKNEFIELYNYGPDPIDLSSLKLHLFNQSGGVDTNVPLTFFNSTIPSNGFFLIATSSFSSSNGAIADATYPTTTAQLVSNGSAYISLSDTADTSVIDLVGWGTSAKNEGAAHADVAAGTSIERKADIASDATTLASGGSEEFQGNSFDEDQNDVDFVVQATPVPQDSFFPPEFAFGAQFNGGGDTDPPTVIGSYPDVATSSFIPADLDFAGVDFNKSMDATTITTSTVTITENSDPGTNLCQSVSYDPFAGFGAGVTCTINPASLPLNATPHTLTVTTGAMDISGNALAAPYTVSFTPSGGFDFDFTGAPFVVGSFPGPGMFDFPPNADFLTVDFSTGMTTASFTGNVEIENLDTTTTTGLSTFAFGTVEHANDSLFIDVSGFSFTAGDEYQLRLTSGITSDNGAALPPFQINFFAADSNDTTGPEVVGTHPGDGDTGVSVGSPHVFISFDEGLSPSTVDTSSVKMKQGVDEVPIEVFYNAAFQEIEISVSTAFEPSTTYTVEILADGDADAVENVSGVTLQDTDGSSNDLYTFDFTTGAADSDAPEALFATGVQNRIFVTFSEPMRENTVTDLSNWTLESPIGSSVPLSALGGGSVFWDPFSNTAELEGFSLTVGDTFEVTASTDIQDMSGNALTSAVTLGGTVLDVAEFDNLGPDSTFTDDFWGLPPAFDDDDWGHVPQPNVFPMNAMAGFSSNYIVDIPISQQIPSSGNGGKIILTFPNGFDVTSADELTSSPVNDDVNGWGNGTIDINSVTADAAARTITIDFDTNTRCDNGNLTPCAGDANDFISLDLEGIVNSSTPRDWETSGYTVDIKTMNGGTVLETMTSVPFFVNAAGDDSLTVDLTATGATTGTVTVHIWSPSTGEVVQDVNFATEGDGTAQTTFNGLPSDFFDVWTDPLLSIGATDDFQGVLNQPVFVTGATNSDFTLAATAGLQTVTIDVDGLAGRELDIVASGPEGFVVKPLTTTGDDTVTMKLADGEWYFDILPHMPLDGGFIMPSPPDYIVTPGSIEVMVAAPNVTEDSGTADDGTIAFTLAASTDTIDVIVQDENGDPIMGAIVFADSIFGGFGTFGETGGEGVATLNISNGTYRVGAFLQGAAPTRELQVLVDGGNAFVEGSTTASDPVVLNISKGGYAISGTVTDGSTSVAGAPVFAYCSANCDGHTDTFSMTDASGAYYLFVDNGTWNVEAFIPGFGPVAPTQVVVSDADQSGVNLNPDSDLTFVTISGTVCQVDGGAADCDAGGAVGISGIDVWAYNFGAGGGENFTQTDQNGDYSLRVPSAAGFTVEAWDPRKGPLPILENVDTSGGNVTDADIVIDSPEGVTINFLDGGAGAVELGEVFIEFFDDQAGIHQSLFVEDATTADIDLPEGDYEIFVNAPGLNLGDGDIAGAGVTSGVLTVDGSETISITVPDLNTVSGTLTDDNTDPVPNAFVEISDPATGIFIGTTTDVNGDWSVSMPDGDFQVNAFSPGVIIEPRSLTVDGNETVNFTGDTTDQSITGTITDDEGDPVANAFVVGQQLGGGTVTVQADANGDFTLPVEDGTWEVSAQGHGFELEPFTTDIEIDGASEADIDIQFDTTVAGLNEPRSQSITPSEGGIGQDNDIGLSVTIPAGATSNSSSPGTLTMRETNNAVDTATTEVVGNAFEITMTDNGGTSLTSGFTEPLTIQQTVDIDDLSDDGVDTFTEADNLAISYFSAAGTWVQEPTTATFLDVNDEVVGSPAADLSNVDSVRFTTAVDHLTVFSITAPSDGVAPAVPASVAASGTTNGITITWDAVTTNSDLSAISDLAGYEVYRDTTAGGAFTTQVNNADILTTTFTDTTANQGTTYFYKVTAGDTGGLESTKSTAVSSSWNNEDSGGNGGGGASPSPAVSPDTTQTDDEVDSIQEEEENITLLEGDEALGITLDEENRRTAPLSDEIGLSPLDGTDQRISTVSAGMFVRSYGYTSVYYVTEDMERRPFWDAQTFFTWADGWNDVVWVTDATLSTMSLDAPMLPKAGTVLVKIQSNPKVYFVESDSDLGEYRLRWIPDETTAEILFGEEWADYIVDMEVTTFARYASGDDMDGTESVSAAELMTRDEVNAF
jgi:hypothetical protein